MAFEIFLFPMGGEDLCCTAKIVTTEALARSQGIISYSISLVCKGYSNLITKSLITLYM